MSTDEPTTDPQEPTEPTEPVEPTEPTLTDAQKKDIREKKNALKRAREAEARAKNAEAELQALRDAADAAEADESQVRLEEKGKYDEALKLKGEAHAKAISAKEAELELIKTAMRQEFGTNKLLKALGEAGVKSEYLGQAAILLKGRVKVELVDGKPLVTALGEDGETFFTSEGDPATIADVAKDFAANNPHFLPPTGDTGSDSHRGGPGPGEKVTQADLRKDPAKLKQFLKDHGMEAVKELPAK